MRKVLVIGLDGVTFELLTPWIKEGRLPTLGRLLAEGASGPLESTSPPISSAAWVSFATGKNPGQHGVVDFVHPEDDYRVSIVGSPVRRSQALWNLVSQAGGRVGVMGVPVTYPPEEVNGFMISDFLTPSSKTDYTYPLSLKGELEERLGGFQLLPSERYRSTAETDKFIADMVADVEKRTEALLYLMRAKPWDFLACVFWSPDMLQHEVWRLLDEGHPQHDPVAAKAFRPLIIDFYQRLDGCLSRILEEVDQEALVVVMSDHGFGPTHNFFLVNTWLLQSGFIKLKNTPLSQAKYLLFKAGFTPLNAFRVAKALRLGFLRRRVRFQRGAGLMKRLFLSFSDVDWRRTRAFAVGSFGQIYINLAGRFREGIVREGPEYDGLRKELMAQASEIRNPYTGEKVVERACLREELYSGAHLQKMPDLILVPQRYEYMAFGHADFGSHRVVEPVAGLSGHHRPLGILGLWGDDIRQGLLLEGARIIDLAPTILYALGLPIPSDMDGRVLEEAFTPQFRERHEATFTDLSSSREGGGSEYTPEDEKEIRERLKGFGYVA